MNARLAGLALALGVVALALSGCNQPNSTTTHALTYDGNGSTAGSAPTDSAKYSSGQTVTVLGNTGGLAKTGYTFTGWNTSADGSGSSYAAGASLTMGSADLVLYASWATTTYAVTYDGNGSTGGAVPTDSNKYASGQTVTVLGNAGSLARTGYSFSGWNTSSTGTGTSYAAKATFAMGSENVTLYAVWAALPYVRDLYMTDTVSGKVYAYDPTTQAASSSALATTGKNASGAIQFYKGIGYVAVGSGTDEGVYYFDPSSSSPSFKKLGASIAAQYFAFASSTKAYVTSYGGGLYSFNPSSPSSGLTQVASITATAILQRLVLGSDGYLYVADNGNGAVLKLKLADESLVATISASAKGATGLSWGSFNGSSGVFVANTGGYDSTTWAPLPGSIDFIASTGSASVAVTSGTSAGASVYPACVRQLGDGNLVATGYDHSYLVAISGASATTTELKAGGSSFGSLDLAYGSGLVYIPVAKTSDYVNYTNYLYVFDASGNQQSYSPVTVMSSKDGISNVAFYE